MIAILAGPTGGLLAWAPTLAALPAPPAQSVTKELAEWDAPPPDPYVWSPDALNWIVPAGVARPLLTQQEFMDRWEVSGAGAAMDLLFALQAKDSTEGAFARKALMRFQTARGIDPADVRTVALTDTMLGMGVGLALFDAPAAATARAIILAPL